MRFDTGPLSLRERCCKRLFDIGVSLVVLTLFSVVIFIAWLIASFETKSNGFFLQERIGRYGRPFRVIKIRTMRPTLSIATTVTVASDPRITFFGAWFRKYKIDELPQLINVLCGDMSLVGPRPDVPGFADQLLGDDRLILMIRPGITGPASLIYRDEEKILARQSNPEAFNRNVIYPHKVKINREYIENYSFIRDVRFIVKTIIG